jgi:hypothetical protein
VKSENNCSQNFRDEFCQQKVIYYLRQDPDPDVLKSQIRTKLVQIHNTALDIVSRLQIRRAKYHWLFRYEPIGTQEFFLYSLAIGYCVQGTLPWDIVLLSVSRPHPHLVQLALCLHCTCKTPS